jgi:hypothetical protein
LPISLTEAGKKADLNAEHERKHNGAISFSFDPDLNVKVENESQE